MPYECSKAKGDRGEPAAEGEERHGHDMVLARLEPLRGGNVSGGFCCAGVAEWDGAFGDFSEKTQQRSFDFGDVPFTSFLFYVGMMGIFTAWAHVFQPVRTSASIGWATSPYEYEVGMADLTVGVLGVLCVWFRGNFWIATAIANAVWLLGDAVGHIREMTLRGNHASNNAGIFLVFEIVVPVVILILTMYTRRGRRECL